MSILRSIAILAFAATALAFASSPRLPGQSQGSQPPPNKANKNAAGAGAAQRGKKQVLSPVPIIPSKRNIEIPGAKASRRINSERPEFYLREPAPDPNAVSTIRKSSRPGENGPEIELVRLTVKGGKRQIESIRSMFGQDISEDRNSVSMQRWDVAKDVYRFTLSQELSGGEYAFAEILPDGVNLYVWDFGVDRKNAARSSSKH